MPVGRRAHILVLASTFPRWQGDTGPMFVADLCGTLSDRFRITVLAPGSKGAARAESWERYEVLRYGYAWPPAAQRLADGAILPNIRRNKLLLAQVPMLVLSQLWHAWRLARSEAFDLIHAHWVLPQGWVGTAIRTQLGLPLLTTAHGADIYALKQGPAARAKRWALEGSSHVTAVSSSLADAIESLGVDRERLSVLPMGVDTRRFRPDARSSSLRRELNPDGPVLLFAGRLVEKKGAAYAMDAMPAVLRAAPTARLVIVGDGPERESLVEQAERLRLSSAVTFLGALPHDQLPSYFASADLFIGPSVVESNGDTESFGLVFAEALASGCPVIATNVGGIADVVVDGETGNLVPQRDAAAIAGAVLELLRNDRQRERLRANGISSMRERFDSNLMAERYGDLMEGLAA